MSQGLVGRNELSPTETEKKKLKKDTGPGDDEWNHEEAAPISLGRGINRAK